MRSGGSRGWALGAHTPIPVYRKERKKNKNPSILCNKCFGNYPLIHTEWITTIVLIAKLWVQHGVYSLIWVQQRENPPDHSNGHASHAKRGSIFVAGGAHEKFWEYEPQICFPWLKVQIRNWLCGTSFSVLTHSSSFRWRVCHSSFSAILHIMTFSVDTFIYMFFFCWIR